MNTQGASSSSSPSSTLRWKYDVFLSFRGEDTRCGFTDHLYAALVRKGIFTFRDNEELERGQFISQELLKSIEQSRFAVIILSRNYASSTWCLDELAKIVNCRELMGLIVLPVFYHVDPSDVRNQRGTFQQAFAKHEANKIPKVENWKAVLKEVGNLSGWHLQDGEYESEAIQSIVDNILQKSNPEFSVITKDLVGIDSPMEELITPYLGLGNRVCMIGICGMGGLGKTTLARVIYKTKCNNFDGSSFIANIKEVLEKNGPNGLVQLQKQLLAQILGKSNIDIWDDCDGADMIKNRLRHKRVLLVLDNVNQLDQLKKLAGDPCWFGLGSWIIITTRNEHLLTLHGVHNIYKPKTLNGHDALELFCLKAFENGKPSEDRDQLSKDVVDYANGLPLALVTLGSFLFGKTMDEWQSALKKLKNNPQRQIFDTLKVSYDGLKEEMWKMIFLDIACFFRGKLEDQVTEILENCGFQAKIGIRVLVEKSLLTIENNKLLMHDLLQEMGWEIVRQESLKEPGERSRLWLRKDLSHVLMKKTATKAIEAIVLDSFGGDEACRNLEACPEAFSKMCNLRLLIIDNVRILNGVNHLSNDLRFLEWHGYSANCLPSNFQPKELVVLKMWFSKIEYLWKDVKYLNRLKLIDLQLSKNLIRTPDFTGVPRLETLCLRGCINLVDIGPSIGQLSRLKFLNLEFCRSLINLPSNMDGLRHLEKLILLGCSKLACLPENLGKIKCLKELDLTGTAIREVPSSISFLICRGCEKQIFKSKLDSFFCVHSLKSLSLSTNKLVFALPSSISQLQKLEALNLGNCILLNSLPEFPSNLRYINAKGCSSLEPSPALLSVGNLLQPSVAFFNCLKLLEYYEGSDGLAFAILKRYLQGLMYPKTGYKTSNKRKDRSGAAFHIIIPGFEVPPWLTHQRFGNSISIELPLNWCNSRWMGFALCAFFRINCCCYSTERYSLKGHVIALGDMPHGPHYIFEVLIGETSFEYSVGHLFLLYLSRDDWLSTGRNYQCNQIKVVFDTNSPRVEVIKSAVRLIYEQDVEDFNLTIAQCSSSPVNTSEGIERAIGKIKDEDKESISEQFRRSNQMQRFLLEILANEATEGNKPSNTFMPGSFARAAQAISEKFGVECQPDHVENCLQTIKSIWSIITQLRDRKNCFGWDDDLKMITCEKKVYDEEVTAHPDHDQYLNKKIEMYDEMALLFGKGIVTWSSAKSSGDMVSEKRIGDLESHDLDTIDFEKASKGKQVGSSNAAFSQARSHRKRSCAKVNQDDNNDKFSKRLGKIKLAVKKLKKYQLDVNELYEEVMKIERFDKLMLASAFDYLVINERLGRAFMVKNTRLRTLWLESFFNKNGGDGN
ncbi:TMV resistance protein N-like [Castanea sativa]|uniref:TMV resistance protein N-like n=1 Tax=Castanea sativa TaxID=21020 RepID=UPI003F64F5D6